MEDKEMANRPRKQSESLTKSKRSFTELSEISERDRRLLDEVVNKLRSLPEVTAVVLFGSFARKDIDRRSDIDLLVVVDREDPGSLRPRISRLISGMKPHREISPILTNLRDLEPTFLRNVFDDGIVLHGKLVLSPAHLALRPQVIIAYDLSGMTQTQKVHISRLIHGYGSRKTVGGKVRTYRYPGLKDRYGATVISRSAILLKPEDARKFMKELESRKVPFSTWEVYTTP
jgi:hypothetical protein